MTFGKLKACVRGVNFARLPILYPIYPMQFQALLVGCHEINCMFI